MPAVVLLLLSYGIWPPAAGCGKVHTPICAVWFAVPHPLVLSAQAEENTPQKAKKIPKKSKKIPPVPPKHCGVMMMRFVLVFVGGERCQWFGTPVEAQNVRAPPLPAL